MKKLLITLMGPLLLIITTGAYEAGQTYQNRCAVPQFPTDGRNKMNCTYSAGGCSGTCSKMVKSAGQDTSNCKVCVDATVPFGNQCAESLSSSAVMVNVNYFSGTCNKPENKYRCECANLSTTGTGGTENCRTTTGNNCLTNSGDWTPAS
jgi:hypothetical protein